MKMKQIGKKCLAFVSAATMLGSVVPVQTEAAWQQDNVGWWWQQDDGNYPASSWQLINGAWYYFDESGYMTTGWQLINGTWYYLGEPGDGAMKTGWQLVNGAWYYLGEPGDGAMKTGWQQVGGTWYYLYDDGRMAADTVIDGYSLDTSGAWVQDGGSSVTEGWVQSGDRWWYQNADGSYPSNSWKLINGAWYYFDASGWMATGWQQIGGDWYYLGEAGDGAMRSSQWVGNYYVKDDGRMATSQWIGEYYVGADGAWVPSASTGGSGSAEPSVEMPAYDAPVTTENILAVLDNLDPDGACIVRDSIEYEGEDMLLAWWHGQGNIMDSLSTAVHEQFHGVSHATNSYNSTQYYVGNGEYVTVNHTSVYDSQEMIETIPEELQSTSRFDTYVGPSADEYMGSRQEGVYGLLNEYTAYCWGNNDELKTYDYQEQHGGSMMKMTDELLSRAEFRYYILHYMVYARDHHPDVYQGILGNDNFRLAFTSVDNKFTSVAEELLEKMSGSRLFWKSDYDALMEEMEKPEYQEMLELLKP